MLFSIRCLVSCDNLLPKPNLVMYQTDGDKYLCRRRWRYDATEGGEPNAAVSFVAYDPTRSTIGDAVDDDACIGRRRERRRHLLPSRGDLK
jgi:hypothetical protein